MFKKLKDLVSREAKKIIGDPLHASRAALSTVLILGIISLTLNLGAQVIPELLGASLGKTLGAGEDLRAINTQRAADQAIVERTRTCIANRKGEKDSKMMAELEKSMKGVLPGIGKLILNDPATAENRKKQLVVEIMRKYTNLKFCIPEQSFDVLYLENYSGLSQSLNTYFQARLQEEDPENNPDGEVHSVGISDLSDEYYYAEQDIRETQQNITDIIDRAIDSAKKLDQQTEDGIARLANVTSNRMAATTNLALERIGEVGATGNNSISSIAKMTETLIKLYAVENSVPREVGMGGSMEPTPKEKEMIARIREAAGDEAVVTDDVQLAQSGLPEVGTEIKAGVDKLIAGDTLSYGLLNLFPIERRPDIAKHLGIAMTEYIGVQLGLDPYTPGSENQIETATNTFAAKINNPDDNQICYSMDPSQAGKDCFGAPAEPTLNTNA
ncbi:MAG: hypothetical protein V2A63_03330 [Patescibacteria group bacterium]